jgi:hypothetical protein
MPVKHEEFQKFLKQITDVDISFHRNNSVYVYHGKKVEHCTLTKGSNNKFRLKHIMREVQCFVREFFRKLKLNDKMYITSLKKFKKNSYVVLLCDSR